MGEFRPLRTSCFEKFLSFHGYKYHRTTASHDQWTRAGKRTIPVWGDEKEIPAMHLRGNCKTIGCTMDEMYAWAKINC